MNCLRQFTPLTRFNRIKMVYKVSNFVKKWISRSYFHEKRYPIGHLSFHSCCASLAGDHFEQCRTPLPPAAPDKITASPVTARPQHHDDQLRSQKGGAHRHHIGVLLHNQHRVCHHGCDKNNASQSLKTRGETSDYNSITTARRHLEHKRPEQDAAHSDETGCQEIRQLTAGMPPRRGKWERTGDKSDRKGEHSGHEAGLTAAPPTTSW